MHIGWPTWALADEDKAWPQMGPNAATSGRRGADFAAFGRPMRRSMGNAPSLFDNVGVSIHKPAQWRPPHRPEWSTSTRNGRIWHTYWANLSSAVAFLRPRQWPCPTHQQKTALVVTVRATFQRLRNSLHTESAVECSDFCRRHPPRFLFVVSPQSFGSGGVFASARLPRGSQRGLSLGNWKRNLTSRLIL